MASPRNCSHCCSQSTISADAIATDGTRLETNSVRCAHSAADSSTDARSDTNDDSRLDAGERPKVRKLSPSDFIFGKVIGEGSFSMVCVAKEINTKRIHAIKICEKSLIRKEKKHEAIMREKDIMYILNLNPSPFVIKLYATFQDVDRLYFVMNYAKNGELLPYINKVGSFDEECTLFYSAELLLGIEHLHKLGIVHRDLKPENILLNENMHIQISDFGSAVLEGRNEQQSPSSSSSLSAKEEVTTQTNRRNSFVGTAQYVSPEMLSDKKASTASDLWAFGCIVYQMTAGLPPFRAPTEYLIFQKILKLDYEFPDGFNAEAKNFVRDLLKREPNERLGGSDDVKKVGYESIRSHSFFQPISHRLSMLHLETPPPILPYLPGTSENEELRSHYQVPDNLEPGLDEKQMTRILGLALSDEEFKNAKSLLDIKPDEFQYRLDKQRQSNPWHRFVENNLILKQGLVDKRKGLFARRRMLLLTTGPHLYYVDPVNMVLKGEIPWSPHLRPESKNFKIFFVHTPNRTYYLSDPEGRAPEWCKAINEVRLATFAKLKELSPTD
ncbi:3-phosphoinositide-dependent protein kinase 1-like protein [Dinothrombium tinctorium]|uniref:3-phosphoinositide-dependent protein kinase 1 n=1 Tax=Dinothrombium tinctorium TaxID=1965070 RepID=A0A3S3PKW8_9ACAR|nr:3-phosphoinositide-dependent protein kinase 1-like protein [Dinothrombium tinctorium]